LSFLLSESCHKVAQQLPLLLLCFHTVLHNTVCCLPDKELAISCLFLFHTTPLCPEVLVENIFLFWLLTAAETSRRLHHLLSSFTLLMWSTCCSHTSAIPRSAFVPLEAWLCGVPALPMTGVRGSNEGSYRSNEGSPPPNEGSPPPNWREPPPRGSWPSAAGFAGSAAHHAPRFATRCSRYVLPNKVR